LLGIRWYLPNIISTIWWRSSIWSNITVIINDYDFIISITCLWYFSLN
jgi:hypothetical protein